MESLGRWLVIFGVAIVVIGGLVWLAGRLLGGASLPGTLRFNIPGGTCVIPLLASIVLSIVLTVLLNLAGRIIK